MAGSPNAVVERIREAHAELGFGIYTGLYQFGTFPHDLTVKNMELFAREVMSKPAPLL